MDAVFRFFFKYPLLVFEQGDFVLGASRPALVAVLAVAALAAAALLTYRSIVSDGSSRDKAVLIALRLALVRDGKVIFEARGTVEGEIAPEPRGAGGFGYDPIFFYPPFGCTLAEAGPVRKAGVSHRGAAFRALAAYLRSVRL